MSTSAKSKSSSKKAIDRPFDPALLRRARDIVEGYQIILHFEDGLYYGRGLEMPTAMNHGKTPDQCVRATRDILTTAVAFMLESGQTPPSPASENKRTEQINVRLTPEEKLLLEDTARSKGFRGISDFVRSASLANAK
jgi:predicted RNase H-like HicB family nuclease